MKRVILFSALFITVALILIQNQSHADNVQIVWLPKPNLSGPMSLEETLAKRRSVRNFSDQKLDSSQISQLAWSAQGVTDFNRGFRTAPSAGAIFPMQLFLATSEGLFTYEPHNHSLKQVQTQDIRKDLAAAALNQSFVGQAACSIIITGSVQKVAARYDRKARDYVLLEAGHIAQNIHLQAVSLGLGSVAVGAFDSGQVRKLCRTGLEPFYIIAVGHPANAPVQTQDTQISKEVSAMQNQTKKAVLIIASENFRDEELFETKQALEQADIRTVIACSKTGSVRGMLGAKAQVQIALAQIDVNDYDAVVFVGGSGAKEYFDNSAALDIARQANAQNKVLAAICIAPAILANAGLLNGLNATSYESERVRLQKAGANFTGSDVEQDGLIITGSGPKAAAEFGRTIAQALKK
ncbi:MAG: DJ-1/PfpI family protein [Phycisphaerae bacterium]